MASQDKFGQPFQSVVRHATKSNAHGRNVGALDVVLELGNLILQIVKRDLRSSKEEERQSDASKEAPNTVDHTYLLVLDDDSDLQLGDTVTDSDELGCTPDETVLLDGANALLKSLHVGLVIPWLDLKGDDGLGSGLGLASLLLLVLGNTLGLDPLSLGILLVIRAEEVNLVIVISGASGSGSSGGGDGGVGGLAVIA